MKSFITLLLFVFTSALQAQTPGKQYYASTGKGHCSFQINKDNTYEQHVFDCTYNFITQGKFLKIADTLLLLPEKIFYTSASNGKKKLVTDSTNGSVIKSGRMNKYLVKSDTLIQLDYFKGKYYPKWELTTTAKKR